MSHETVSIDLPEALAVFAPELAAQDRTSVRCCEAGLLAQAAVIHGGELPEAFREAMLANTLQAARELGIDLVVERRPVAATSWGDALDVVSGPVRRLDLMEVVITRAHGYCLWGSKNGMPMTIPARPSV